MVASASITAAMSGTLQVLSEAEQAEPEALPLTAPAPSGLIAETSILVTGVLEISLSVTGAWSPAELVISAI